LFSPISEKRKERGYELGSFNSEFAKVLGDGLRSKPKENEHPTMLDGLSKVQSLQKRILDANFSEPRSLIGGLQPGGKKSLIR
jgi:hypothetical protein